MAVGDIIFYHWGDDWRCKLIRWVTRGPYAHCAVDVGDGQCIETQWDGVVKHAIEPGGDVFYASDKLNAGMLPLALEFLDKQVGKHYSCMNAYSLLACVVLSKRKGKRRSNWTCSELASAFLFIGLYPLPLDMLWQMPYVSPNLLARALGMIA